MPVNPTKFRNPVLGNILVSAADPLLNLGLAIICIIMLIISAGYSNSGILSGQFFWLAAKINLVLFMFNL
jgi:Zn-dependent protease